jgi:hypothetical protein
LAVLFQCVSEKKSHKFLREEEIQVKWQNFSFSINFWKI